jgi:hypothetical protein
MLGMRLDRFWRYAQALRHALIRMTPANKLQNDELTRAEVRILHPRGRVFFTYPRNADGSVTYASIVCNLRNFTAAQSATLRSPAPAMIQISSHLGELIDCRAPRSR